MKSQTMALPEPSEQSYDSVKSELRYYYVQRRSSQRPYNTSLQDEKLLGRGTEFCMSNDLEPRVLVAACFEGATKTVLPQFLYGNSALQKYKSYIASRTIPLQKRFDTQYSYLRDQLVNNDRDIEDTLMDDRINMSAWFRIVITTAPMDAVIRKYRIKAMGELVPEVVEFITTYNSTGKTLDINRIDESHGK